MQLPAARTGPATSCCWPALCHDRIAVRFYWICSCCIDRESSHKAMSWLRQWSSGADAPPTDQCKTGLASRSTTGGLSCHWVGLDLSCLSAIRQLGCNLWGLQLVQQVHSCTSCGPAVAELGWTAMHATCVAPGGVWSSCHGIVCSHGCQALQQAHLKALAGRRVQRQAAGGL